jgi:thiosulfate dehydrogenase
MRRALWIAGLAAALAAGCTQQISGAERGEELFRDPGITESPHNTVSCATCHQVTATSDPARIDPGYSLYGVAARSRYWGDKVYNLADAVNVCLVFFMRGQELDETSEDARAIYEYLLSITPDGSPSDPLPVTVTENIVPIPLGDATAGEAIYQASCQHCHGEAHTGSGNITDPVVDLPEYAIENYPKDFPGIAPGLVVIEKVRHGRFFDVGGYMPFYSSEILTDDQIGDLLAFLGLDPSTP